jgi:hypothetical protein
MKHFFVGDLVRMDFTAASQPEWQHLDGTLGVIINTDPEQGSVFVVSQYGVEEIYTTHLEVISESR